MKDETMDMFLGAMSEVRLKAFEPLIDYGALDGNVYILKSGIIRYAYWNGFKEMTHAFCMSGTMMISYYPYFMDEPSFFKYEACCDSVVMKITKTKFKELSQQSHDFAQWVMSMWAGQQWSYEKKLQLMNGTAKERFEAMIRDGEDRPSIMEKVPKKYISAYIGITPQYLCQLRRMFTRKSKT
jgi:CRP-like cAMP-binding protein